MRAIYFDCFSGASGDMLLGALIDAGASVEALRAGLASLPVSGWSLDAEPVHRQGLRGTHARVRLTDQEHQPHRGLHDVLAVIQAGRLPPPVAERASRVFRRLAEVEAGVHGTSVDEVHFHEVGAVDAIVDVVGVVLALHLLEVDPDQVFSSGLPTGTGWVKSSHGPLPVPAPATLELLRAGQVPLRPAPQPDVPGELTTPTGAALLSTLAVFREPLFPSVERTGYGFGTRAFPWPNALRAWLGVVESADGDLQRDTVLQVETHLDDATPEQLAYAMERLLAAGALDVAFVPLQMKKNRPGVLLRVLGRPGQEERLVREVLLHTTALGARVQSIGRLIARREEREVETPWGRVRVKDKLVAGQRVPAPEYEDCAALARAAGVPLMAVYDAARAAAAKPTGRQADETG